MTEVTEFFNKLLGTESWPARWHCGRWTDFHGWLYICSDLAIWAAYFVIPFFLIKLIKQRPSIPFPAVFYLFGAFILLCGLTHLFDVSMFWWPAYRLNALIRFATACVSWATIVAMIKLLPQILALKTSGEFEAELLERKKVEEKVSNIVEQLSQAQEIAKIGSWLWDIPVNTITWSDELYRIYGLQPQQIPATFDITDKYIHPDDKEFLSRSTAVAYRNKKPFLVEYRIILWNETVRTVNEHAQVIYDESGRAIRMIGVVHDVTEAKQVEKNLKKETMYVKLLQDVSVAANEASSIESAAQICLDKICEMTHWPVGHFHLTSKVSPNKLISTNIWHLTEQDYFKTFKEITESTNFEIGIGIPGKVLKNKAPVWVPDVSTDHYFPRNIIAGDLGVKTGFAFPVMVKEEVVAVMEFFSTEVIDNPDKKLLEVTANIGMQLGRVAERKRAADELYENEEQLKKLSLVASNTDNAIFIFDAHGKVEWVNDAFVKISGYQLEELIGEWAEILRTGMPIADTPKTFLKVINDKKPISYETINHTKYGQEYWVHTTLSPTLNEKGEIQKIIAIDSDITKLKETESELIEAKKQAEHLAGAKDQFLA
jgi:PAS domain S-box-containing protein